ncbi:MAG: hypothetical protein ACI4JC_04650 [Faecalibacterium sp.]
MKKLLSLLLTGALCCAMLLTAPMALCRAEEPDPNSGSSSSQQTGPTDPKPVDPDPVDPDPSDPNKDPESPIQPRDVGDPNEEQV